MATRSATDNLMLTYGWRKFKWDDILANKKPAFEFLPEYEGHIITGTISDKKTGIALANIPTYLSVPGVQYRFGNFPLINANGRVQYDIRNFVGAAEIVVQAGQKRFQYAI